MASQGTFDPSGYIAGNVATYPTPAAGVYYQPGMWWEVDPAGVFDGTAVSVGDRIHVFGTGRLFGDLTFGELVFGGPDDRDWLPNAVTFEPWISTLPPDLTDPLPYSGCPLGDRYPGWRLVIDALFNSDDGSRTFGMGTFGSDVFGDLNGAGKLTWSDITEAGYSVTTTRGTTDGAYIVDVDQLTIEFTDPDGDWFDFPQPQSYYRPTAGDAIRVGVVDPAHQYHPLAVGEIERVTDEHLKPPRLVTIEAFGFVMDLVSTIPQHQQHPGTIQQIVLDMLAEASWRWGQPVAFPQPSGPVMLGDTDPGDVIARDQLDQLAISAGWTMDADVRGSLRFREWPLDPTGSPVEVVDCVGHGATGLLAGFVIFADYDAMLNIAQMTNVDDVLAEAFDLPSTGRHGRRTENLGFPVTDAYGIDQAAMQTLVDRIVSRLGRIIVRVAGIEVDTAQDTGWVPVLADIDSGDAVVIHRRGLPVDLDLDAYVTGVEHRIQPNRWRSTIHTSTTTITRSNP